MIVSELMEILKRCPPDMVVRVREAFGPETWESPHVVRSRRATSRSTEDDTEEYLRIEMAE